MAKPQHTVILLIHFTSQSDNVYIRYEINTHLCACVYILYVYFSIYVYCYCCCLFFLVHLIRVSLPQATVSSMRAETKLGKLNFLTVLLTVPSRMPKTSRLLRSLE